MRLFRCVLLNINLCLTGIGFFCSSGILFCSLVCLPVVVCLPAAAQVSSLDSNLSTLENKLFLHDYSSDTTDARLTRLEDMVFGERKSGSPQDRLKKLAIAISGPDLPVPTSDTTPASSKVNRSQRRAAAVGSNTIPPPALAVNRSTPNSVVSLPPFAPPVRSWVTANFSAPPYSVSSTSPSVPSYLNNLISKVDWLENTLFGRTYSDPLSVRVLRLEGKVFPQEPPATNLSLTERVTRLLNAVTPINPTSTLPPAAPSIVYPSP